jgi:Fe2+ transport system protein FeoA
MGQATRASRGGLRAVSGGRSGVRRPGTEPVSLTTLRAGQSGRVVHVAPGDPQLMVKLSSLGVLPGAIVELQQKFPAAVVRVGETTVALDGEIAAEIFVLAE